ncbi:hypothetical protein DPEC_G00315390 [Dallia pectoralis]|uniref:Uncharacterized protein n=1 Tax=Dallia pectoralis TaxID=75939 RepID=A0ACC2FCJ4_DALPE|nr:hypothetical protein DPEC_G00315390 [Dallia pectoralis]
MRADRKLEKTLFAMKTKWWLCVLWSVYPLTIANATFSTYGHPSALRPVNRNILKLGTSKGVGGTLRAHLSPAGNDKSSVRIPSASITYTPLPKQSSAIAHSSPRHQGNMLLNTPAPKSEHAFASLPDVSVTCSGDDFVVRVKRAFYGLQADAQDLTLGSGCKSNGVLMPYGDVLFAYSMTECDGKREIHPGYLVYTFVLQYAPLTRIPHKAHRLDVEIQCRLQRYFHVYQRVVRPTWETPVVHKRLKGRPVDFYIQLMDDAWSVPAKSQVYILGQPVNFQVSATHRPRGGKLFINHCYAATSNDPTKSRKYPVIDNFGCMLESQQNVGTAEFVLPISDDTVRFSISAFQFNSDPDTPVFLHCKLHVTSDEYGPMHKFCTYKENRWRALVGKDSVCDCCDLKCRTSKPRRAMVEGFASSEPLLFSDQPSSPRSAVSQVDDDDGDDKNVWFANKFHEKMAEFDNADHLLAASAGKNHGDALEQSHGVSMEKDKQHVDDGVIASEGERSEVVRAVLRTGKIFRGTHGSALRDSERIIGEAPDLRADEEEEELSQDFLLVSDRVGLKGRRPWTRVDGPESREEASGEDKWTYPLEESSSLGSGMEDESVSQEEAVSPAMNEWELRAGDEQLLEIPKDEWKERSANEERAGDGNTMALISEAVEKEILGDDDGLVESAVADDADLPRVWHFTW